MYSVEALKADIGSKAQLRGFTFMFIDFSLIIPFNSVHIIESIAKFMKSMDFTENLGHTRKFVLNYAIIKGLLGQKMRIFDNIYCLR